VFQPPQATHQPVLVVVYFPGLIRTANNLVAKAGGQRHFADLGLTMVCPDASPHDLLHHAKHSRRDFA